MKIILCVLCVSLAFAQQPARAPLPDEKGIVVEAEKKLAADPTNDTTES